MLLNNFDIQISNLDVFLSSLGTKKNHEIFIAATEAVVSIYNNNRKKSLQQHQNLWNDKSFRIIISHLTFFQFLKAFELIKMFIKRKQKQKKGDIK